MRNLAITEKYYPRIDFESKSGDRYYYFDNLKFLLTCLVVIGHFIDPMTSSSQLLRSSFFFIYLFHMPLFIFVSGYFSKSIINEKGFRTEKVFSYIIIYFILRVLEFIILRWVFGKVDTEFRFFNVNGVPWYMFAMAIWLCTIPVIHKFKAIFVLGCTIIIGIIVGYDSTVKDFLCLSRLLVFAPFFYAGYYININQIQNLLNKKIKVISLLAIVIIFAIIYLNEEFIYNYRGLLTGRNSYVKMELENGAICRIIYYVMASVTSIIFMMLVPRTKVIFSKLGERTLQVYCLHFIVYILYKNYKWYKELLEISVYWKIGIIILSIILTVILSSKIFEKPFKFLMNIKLDKFYKEKRSNIH